jgi:hypothetical protein
MKKLSIALLILATANLFSQKERSASKSDLETKGYLGFGAGLENYNGLIGVGTNIRLHKGLFLRGGLRLGSWGYKYGIGLRVGKAGVQGGSVGLTFCQGTGLKEFKTPLEVYSGGKRVTEDVLLNLNPASSINLSYIQTWIVGKKNMINLEFGYAFKASNNPYTVLDGSSLTGNGITVLETLRPGGLNIGFGFMFGL